MSMTKRAMEFDEARLAELVRAVIDDLMLDEGYARHRIMQLDDHDLKVFAAFTKTVHDLATSELEFRRPKIRRHAAK